MTLRNSFCRTFPRTFYSLWLFSIGVLILNFSVMYGFRWIFVGTLGSIVSLLVLGTMWATICFFISFLAFRMMHSRSALVGLAASVVGIRILIAVWIGTQSANTHTALGWVYKEHHLTLAGVVDIIISPIVIFFFYAVYLWFRRRLKFV